MPASFLMRLLLDHYMYATLGIMEGTAENPIEQCFVDRTAKNAAILIPNMSFLQQFERKYIE